ncbi:MAG TPA: PAC2 family protein [Candidatus Deferrimicrobium sp.]|nr:PAC2 family protein [Candidatus Deferrimicrobium sp.]
MSSKIIIEIQQEIDFENSTFITGFHGIGWTGYIAIRHLIKTAETERIGYILGDNLPDVICLEEERLILPFEFHKYKNFIIFQPPFQPIPIEHQEILHELALWIVKSKFREAILLGGLDIRFQQKEEKLRIVPTKNFIETAKTLNIPFLEKGLLIRGPLALLLTHLEVLNFPAAVILPYAMPNRPDPAAAADAIEFLNEHYHLDLSTTQLHTDAQMIEDEIEEILRQERERSEQEPRDMYI